MRDPGHVDGVAARPAEVRGSDSWRHDAAIHSRTAPFDALADGYDAVFTRTLLGRILRNVVLAELARHVHPGDRVLDLGCGTGEDALWLARRGVDVTAIDASPQMIRVTRDKAIRQLRDSEGNLSSAVADLVTDELPEGPFDVVLSNFGALNLVPLRSDLSRRLSRVVRPGGRAIFVVMGRYCVWEWVWYLARLQPSTAFRRMRPGVRFRGALIHYPTPATLEREFGDYFKRVRTAALGLVLPPSYAAGFLERHAGIGEALARIEQSIRRVPAIYNLSDHFIMEFVRR